MKTLARTKKQKGVAMTKCTECGSKLIVVRRLASAERGDPFCYIVGEEIILVGWYCKNKKCCQYDFWFPRKLSPQKISPWDVCYKCGGSMDDCKQDDALQHRFQCSDCGHSYFRREFNPAISKKLGLRLARV